MTTQADIDRIHLRDQISKMTAYVLSQGSREDLRRNELLQKLHAEYRTLTDDETSLSWSINLAVAA